MNKKIIAIGIIALFLLTGFSIVSEGKVKQSDSILKTDGPEPAWKRWKRGYVSLDLDSIENVEMTIGGNPVDIFGMQEDDVFEDIVIKGNQLDTTEDNLFSSMCYSFFANKVIFYIGTFLFVIENLFPDVDMFEVVFNIMKSMPGVYIIKPGQFTITVGSMDNISYAPSPVVKSIFFRGFNIEISQ
jgi:hypothetical protein